MMLATGVEGYQRAADSIMELTDVIAAGIRAIPELQLLVDPPQFGMVAFASPVFDVYKLMDALHGWNLNVLQYPAAIHFCFTMRHVESNMSSRFLKDLTEAVANVKARPQDYVSKAPMYAMTASLPDRSIIRDIAIGYLDTTLKVFPGTKQKKKKILFLFHC